MKHGAHIASIGGTWMALVYGFAGLRDYGGRISFHPSLPAEWRSLRFRLRLQGRLLEMHVDHRTTHYRLMEGEGLTFRHSGKELHLTAAEPEAYRPTPRSPTVEPGAGPGSSDPKVPGT
jgi:alpha,alpha-trehalose phosphorylase